MQRIAGLPAEQEPPAAAMEAARAAGTHTRFNCDQMKLIDLIEVIDLLGEDSCPYMMLSSHRLCSESHSSVCQIRV